MKRSILLISALAILALLACNEKSIELRVGPDNTQAQFASIQEAIKEAKEIRLSNHRARITIHILPGSYFLKSPIQISPDLNGLTIEGEDASKVRLKGSVPLQLNWNKTDANIYESSVPLTLDFDQLIVDGKAQILARYPNYNEDGGQWQGHAPDAISKDRIQSWKNPRGAIFHAMHKGRWGGFHYLITGVDEGGNALLEGGYQNNRPSPPHETYRMVENVLEELDSPGEWFLDKENQKLYYWPGNGIDLSKSSFEGVILENFISLMGSENKPVQNVTIRGISFENSRKTFLNDYEPLLRSDWSVFRGGAIFIEGAENCSIQQCEFSKLGGNVVFVSAYNRNISVTGNHIHDCGASAILFVGDASAVRSPSFQYSQFVPLVEMDTVPGPKNELYPRECLVENNLIYRIGRIEKQTAGVQIAMSMDIVVRHNSIYEVPRAGINIGDGTWGGHLLEYNDVFNTVLETGDHGSFNSWGRDRFWHPNRKIMDSITMTHPDMPGWDAIHTTIIRNNRFRCDHGWDIDLDDGSSNYHIYNNLCLNGGIKLREGFNRVVENNIIVNNGFHPHVWFEKSEDEFCRNIVGREHADIRLQGWGKLIDYNLFPDEESLIKAQINKVDDHSSYGDPIYNNPAVNDFSVSGDSPALELGFVNFPMDQFGVQGSLKILAKTPQVPDLTLSGKYQKGQNPAISWLRTKLKTVESKEEQSAYGLSKTEGVIVLDVQRNSIAGESGLKKGDVILSAQGSKTNRVNELLIIHRDNNELDSLNLTLMRNQSKMALRIRIK